MKKTQAYPTRTGKTNGGATMNIPKVKRHICYGEYQHTLNQASKRLKSEEYYEFEAKYNKAVDEAINPPPYEYNYQDVANVLEEYEQRLYKDYVNSDYYNNFAIFRVRQIENLLSMLQEEFSIERHRSIKVLNNTMRPDIKCEVHND